MFHVHIFSPPVLYVSSTCVGIENHHIHSTIMVLRMNSLLLVAGVRRRAKVAAAVKLLAKGADRHLRDHEGRTAMDWAERFGSTRLLDVLLFDPNKVRRLSPLVAVSPFCSLSRMMYYVPHGRTVIMLRVHLVETGLALASFKCVPQ